MNRKAITPFFIAAACLLASCNTATQSTPPEDSEPSANTAPQNRASDIPDTPPASAPVAEQPRAQEPPAPKQNPQIQNPLNPDDRHSDFNGWTEDGLFIRCILKNGCERDGIHYDRGAELHLPDGWFKDSRKNVVRCLNTTGCLKKDIRFQVDEAVPETLKHLEEVSLPVCGKEHALDKMDGFVCNEHLWQCQAQTCDCMGTTIARDALCTLDGPYQCNAWVDGAKCIKKCNDSFDTDKPEDCHPVLSCHDEELDAADIPPHDYSVYRCSEHWTCSAEKCQCGHSMIDRDETCRPGSNVYDGMADFTTLTVMYEGTCHITEDYYYCNKSNGCLTSDGRHYPYGTSPEYEYEYQHESIEIYHYDSPDTTETKTNTGDCVIQDVREDHLVRINALPGSSYRGCVPFHTMDPEDSESRYDGSDPEEHADQNDDAAEMASTKQPSCMKSWGSSIDIDENESSTPIDIYIGTACTGGTLYCHGKNNQPEKKPGNGYICTDVMSLPGTETRTGLKAWVCNEDNGCECSGSPCPRAGICHKDQCIVDDNASPDLCKAKEIVISASKNNRVISHTTSCPCGEKNCPIDSICIDGDCYCKADGDIAYRIPQSPQNYVCIDGKWGCESNCLCGGLDISIGISCINETISTDDTLPPYPRNGKNYTLKKLTEGQSQWVCQNDDGCLCGTENCIKDTACIDNQCFCNGHKITSGYQCRFGNPVCTEDSCMCGESSCPKNAACNEGICKCTGIPQPQGPNRYLCEKATPKAKARTWQNPPEGQACGNSVCTGGAICSNGICLCGQEENPGSDYTCEVTLIRSKLNERWICNAEQGCHWNGVMLKKGDSPSDIQKDQALSDIQKDQTLPDIHLCGNIQYDRKEQLCRHGVLIDLKELRTSAPYDDDGKCHDVSCPCGEEVCPFGAVCRNSRCLDSDTLEPVARKDGYLIHGSYMMCAEDTCPCSGKPCKRGEYCVLDTCIDYTANRIRNCVMGSTCSDSDHWHAHDYLHSTQVWLGNTFLSNSLDDDWFLGMLDKDAPDSNLPDNVEDDYAQEMIRSCEQVCSELECDDYFAYPLCVNPSGCACGDKTCAAGMSCNRSEEKCEFTDRTVKYRCGTEDEPKVLSLDENGNCRCHGTTREGFVTGYRCDRIGWVCSSESGCACGSAQCRKDEICYRPGECIQ